MKKLGLLCVVLVACWTGSLSAQSVTVQGGFVVPLAANLGGTGVTSGSALVPVGGIIMWSGTLVSIPANWQLCDGTNGTPNLTNGFVKCVSSGQNPGSTGGSATATYTPQGTNGTASFTPSGTVAWPAGVPTFSGNSGTVPAETFTGSSGTVPAETISWPAGVPTFSGSSGTVPAETISWPAGVPTFAGSAMATHAHELPIQLVSATSARLLVSSTFGTGTSRTSNGAITPTSNATAAAVALSQAVSAGTPSGTVAWPAGVPTNGTVSFTPSGTVAWPAGVPTNGTVSFTPVGTNGTASFTPAGTVAWPAGVPTFAGSGGTVPAQTFTGTQATISTEPVYFKLAFIERMQ